METMKGETPAILQAARLLMPRILSHMKTALEDDEKMRGMILQYADLMRWVATGERTDDGSDAKSDFNQEGRTGSMLGSLGNGQINAGRVLDSPVSSGVQEQSDSDSGHQTSLPGGVVAKRATGRAPVQEMGPRSRNSRQYFNPAGGKSS